MYTRDAATTVDVTKQHTLIAGETEDVEFFSTNRDRSNNPEGVDCQYVRILFPLANANQSTVAGIFRPSMTHQPEQSTYTLLLHSISSPTVLNDFVPCP